MSASTEIFTSTGRLMIVVLGGLADVEREAFPFVAFLLQCNQAPGPALV
ncbi:MAG: hypothetical protein JO110_16100 [Acetobacteraceae bacterium]|nr:hypothetical protein [Acetobacteraceae bacterium]